MSDNIFDLSGKVAVVTGAGRGLCKAMAIGLADAGAKVVCAARTAAEIEDTAKEIGGRGGEAMAVACDAASRDDCERLIAATVDAYGRLDVMLVGHGVGGAGLFSAEDTPGEEFERIMAINLTGCFNAAQFAARRMIGQGGGGSIILVSSTASLVAFPGSLAYGVSKGGVDQMMREMAAAWGPHDIRVNTINPGYTTHSMRGGTGGPDAELEADIRRLTPLQRSGEPAEFAGPAVFLASDASSFVTGVVLPVDGGYCAL